MVEFVKINTQGVIHAMCHGHGHDQTSRFGELMDNAIDQDARACHIGITEDYIYILDNGNGMDEEGTKSLTSIYTPKERKAGSNGKYNIGMAAAIASQTGASDRNEPATTHAIVSLKEGSEDVVRLIGSAYKKNIIINKNGNAKNIEKVAFVELLRLAGFDHGTLIVIAKNKNKILNDKHIDEIIIDDKGKQITSTALHPAHFLHKIQECYEKNTYSDLSISKKDVLSLWWRVMGTGCEFELNGQPFVPGSFTHSGKQIQLLNLFSDDNITKKVTFEVQIRTDNSFYIHHKSGFVPPNFDVNKWHLFQKPKGQGRGKGNFPHVMTLCEEDEERSDVVTKFELEAALTKPEIKSKGIGRCQRYYERCKIGISQMKLSQMNNSRYVEKIIWDNYKYSGFDVSQNKSVPIKLHDLTSKGLKAFAQYIIRSYFNENEKETKEVEPPKKKKKVRQPTLSFSPPKKNILDKDSEEDSDDSSTDKPTKKTSRKKTNEAMRLVVMVRQRNECAVTSISDKYFPTDLDHDDDDKSNTVPKNMIGLGTSIHNMKAVPGQKVTEMGERFKLYRKEAEDNGGYSNGVGYSKTSLADLQFQLLNSRGFQLECLHKSKLNKGVPGLFTQYVALFEKTFPGHKVPNYNIKDSTRR